MEIFLLLLRMIGGLCMFLFGMKIMSEGLQKSAGERMRKALGFMTGNRFAGVLTGFVATAIIQSSSAFTIIVISFVNAGLLTLTQSIGVIFGTNIGTTLTAWIISLVGFRISIEALALPAIGIGFIISITKWKYKSIGDFMIGFGFLFLGLHYLTEGMANADVNYGAIGVLRDRRLLAMLTGVGVGLVMTVLINSSTASVALIILLAFQDIITYEMAAGMILGSNLGTTLTAALAGMAGNVNSKRAALVHVLFNTVGILWALPLIFPLLDLVNLILPGNPWTVVEGGNPAIPVHIAGLHTIYNIINTLIFLPFVNQFAKLVTFLVPDKKTEDKSEHYKFSYLSTTMANSPEFNILRAEKEISDMAGIVSFMYSRFCTTLRGLHEGSIKDAEKVAVALCEELEKKEQYIDEMRETLSAFLVECTRVKLNPRSEDHVVRLLRVSGSLEEMSDECYSISRLLEKSIRKKCVFKRKKMDELIPYVSQVEEFLSLMEEQLDGTPTAAQRERAQELEDSIDRNRKKLDKLGRKRIEAGGDVRTELYFIDLVRRIEKLGDYCFEISEAYG